MSKRRFLALLVAVIMLLTLIPTAALADTGDVQVFNEAYKLINGSRIRVYTNTIGPGDTQGGYVTDDRWTYLSWQGEWNFVAHAKEGYQFDGWTTSGSPSGAYAVNGANLKILSKNNSDYYANAHFSFVGYTVTINLGDGSTFDDTGLNTKTITGLSPGTLNVPAYTVKPGYNLAGWNGSFNISADTTINAKYEYQVTFAGNAQVTITGGSPAWTVNHTVAEPSYTVAAGYRFDGWDRSLSGISAPCTITASPAVGRGTISLEHTSGGYFAHEDRVEGTYDDGTSLRLSDSAPVANIGWDLRGWKVGDSEVLLPKDAVVTVSGDQKYTAVFYDIEYLRTKAGANGSLGNPLSTHEYGKGDKVNLNISQPQANYGYMFDKWIETNYFDNYQRDVALVGGEPIITVGDSNYFKALFRVAEYTVTFVDSQGETLGTEVVLHGGSVTKTAGDFTYDEGERPVGDGWAAAEGQNITSSKTIVVNTEYKVTFDIGSGTRTGGGELTQWIAYDGNATAPDVNPPSSAQLTGWDKSLSNITQAQTITAKYEYLVEYLDDAGNVLASEYVAQGGNAVKTQSDITLPDGQRFKNSPAWDSSLGQGITASTQITVELEYKVTFDLGGGTRTGGGELIQWVAYNASAAAPVFDDPAKAHFIGWDKSLDNITQAQTIAATYEYLVEFVDDAGNVLASEYVAQGADAITTQSDITLPDGQRFKNSPAWDAALAQGITAPTQITVELEYKVTFDLDGGTRTGGGELVQWVAYGADSSAPDVEAPTGMSFDGWDSALTNITQAQTITAQYLNIEYTLTINYLNRADNSVLNTAYTGIYYYNDPYAVTSPALIGYDVPSIAIVSGNMPAEDLTVDVYYDTHSFTLTYMQNDGDTPTDLRQYRVFHNDGVFETYPVTLGYRIAGTPNIITIGDIESVNSKTNRFTDPFLFTTNPIGIAPSGETCIVYWYDKDNQEWIQADTKAGATLYQVIFDANGGEFADATIVKLDFAYVGGNVQSPDLPIKEGFTFIGWDINNDGVIDALDDLNTDGIYDGTDIDEISVNANITIKAMYVINTFEVKFFDYDATQIGATQIIDWNTAATAPADPTREGYTFTGWDKAFSAVTADLNVTATYTINTFEVKFFDYDATQIGATQIIDWNTAATAPADPTRTGYRFTGWDKTFNAVTADLEVTATYTIRVYTVTFVDYDGTVLGTDRVAWRNAATAPEDPTRDGFEFTGWDAEFSRVTGNLTVTALYEAVIEPEAETGSFIVQFFDADGNLLSEQTVELNGAAQAPEAPDREGYEFAGWDTEFDNVTEDLVVTAMYNDLAPTTETIEDEPGTAASPGNNVFPWWWILIGVGAAAALFFIIFFAARKKKGEQQA